ncbi:MAG: hypothetical protein M3082_11630 [Candidatus Dormibacteraeota bacterium]|nr:hypothetical protein [Candidatus Dormibacteraeota bacterium]
MAMCLAVWGGDESSPDSLDKLTKLNRGLGSDNLYDRIDLAERWRMGRTS